MSVNIMYEGHVCELQIELAAMLEVKHDAHKAYELIRSLDLEGDLEATPTRLTDLADACSPAKRVVLGILRFVTATFSSLIGALYIAFGVCYSSDGIARSIGTLVFGDVEVPGLLFAAFLAPPFAMVAVVALRDLVRQVATVYADKPCQKRAIQLTVAGLFWLASAMIVVPFLANPVTQGFVQIHFMSILFVWSPALIIYAWATVPGNMNAVTKRSRLRLLYDKYFGLNGQVRLWAEA